MLIFSIFCSTECKICKGLTIAGQGAWVRNYVKGIKKLILFPFSLPVFGELEHLETWRRYDLSTTLGWSQTPDALPCSWTFHMNGKWIGLEWHVWWGISGGILFEIISSLKLLASFKRSLASSLDRVPLRNTGFNLIT